MSKASWKDQEKEKWLKRRGFGTPASDYLIWLYGQSVALVYGKIWRYCNSYGSCTASQDRIGREVGLSEFYVNTIINTILVKHGWIKDHTPSRRNRPHKYTVTNQIQQLEEYLLRHNSVGTTTNSVESATNWVVSQTQLSTDEAGKRLVRKLSSKLIERLKASEYSEEEETLSPPPDVAAYTPPLAAANGTFPADFDPDDWALNLDQEITGWCSKHEDVLIDGAECSYCEEELIPNKVHKLPEWSTVAEIEAEIEANE